MTTKLGLIASCLLAFCLFVHSQSGPPIPPGFEEWASENMSSFGDPEPPGGGGGTGYDPGSTNNYTPFNFTNGLWLSIYGSDTNWMTLVLHNTWQGEFYEILTKTDLNDAAWNVEQGFLGTDDMTLVPSISVMGKTNFFFWARHANLDSDGDGLPDWYEISVTGTDPFSADTGDTGVPDGYRDVDGDGWTNLDELRNGTNPNAFNTPRAPQGLKVDVNLAATEATLSWQTPSGPITGYTVQRLGWGISEEFTLSSTGNPFIDTGTFQLPIQYSTSYRVQAHYSSGSSEWSEEVATKTSQASAAVSINRGSEGSLFLLTSALPSNTEAVRLTTQTDFFGNPGVSFEIPITNFVNGAYEMNEMEAPFRTNRLYHVQLVGADGKAGKVMTLVPSSRFHFFDGREQLKQNLSFLLRAASDVSPFYMRLSPTYYELPDSRPSDYVWSGFVWNYGFHETNPFYDNHVYRNFVFSSLDVNSSGFLPGITWDQNQQRVALSLPGRYPFETPTNAAPISALLDTETSEWLYQHEAYAWSEEEAGPTGLFYLPEWQIGMINYASNFFGLPYISHKLAYSDNGLQVATLIPGGAVDDHWGGFYAQTEEPELETVDYYFAREGVDSIPGDENFQVTNSTPLFILRGNIDHWNQKQRFLGYAKQTILNGDPNKFAYLGQYFDKAWKVDLLDNITTNETGVLSEYGDFFPTEPGRVWLKTKPNFGETNTSGCYVHVIKLELDVNHDGEIDPTFAGPDNTSPSRPFRFWLNNDLDLNDKDIQTLPPPNGLHDFDSGMITCARGLEDFARLWISGMPTLDSSYEVKLSMVNVSGNPTINLYNYTADTNGGAGYLTDTNVAQAILSTSDRFKLDQIGSFSSYTFPSGFFTNDVKRHFLFEGAGAGTGELVLTIRKNGQVIGETSAWIELKDIKEMYERAVADNAPSGYPPSDRISRCVNINTLAPDPNEAKQLIVFVHGINNTEWEYHNTSETMFKRLYWSGYQGRFAAFRWHSPLLPECAVTIPRGSPFNYNRGEYIAWKSATAFATCLNRLRARFPDYSINVLGHSMGNIVASEALRLGGEFDNYIMSQAAVPAHCYDVTAPSPQKFLNAEQSSPTPLQAADGGYHGYFTNITGRIINFYNPVDFALVGGTCIGLDTNWEKNHESQKPETIAFPATVYGFNTNALECFADVTVHTTTTRRILSDSDEKKAMVARTRSKAVGALANVGGVLSTNGAIDLNSVFGFNDTRSDHSAQFNRNIQSVRSYFQQILRSYQIDPAP